jgi:hypothetical protein
MSLSLHQTMNVSKASTDRQQSINHFGCCISYNPRAVLRLVPIIEVLGTIIGNMVNVDVPLPDNERQQSVNRASTERQQSLNRASTEPQQSLNRVSTESQQSLNRASTEPQQSLNRVSTEPQHRVNRASTERHLRINRTSTERQQSCVLHLAQSKGSAMAFTHNQNIGSLSGPKRRWHGHSPSLRMSGNRASTILCVASCIIQGLCYSIYL